MKEFLVSELVKQIKSGEITSESVVKEYIESIEEKDSTINAFLLINKEEALKKAKEIDEKVIRGERLGALAGIPIAIKDNICTKGLKTTCSSKMLEDFVSPYDATVIKKLMEEDAIIIGKTNMDEFAMGSSTETSAFKKTLNPVDLSRVPGGSSGGSAAAVSAKMVPIALGSDTGGSIRQPASFCNIVGLKPTYGLVSRFGLIAFASSLDQIGPMANSVEDCAYLLNIIAGEDNLDATSIKGLKHTDYTEGINDDIKGIRIGVPKEFIDSGLDPEVKKSINQAIDILKELGAEVTEFSFPLLKESLAAYYIVSSAEASSNLSRFDGVRYGYRPKEYNSIDELMEKARSEAFGKEVKRRIMLGTYCLSSGYYDAYYKKASEFRDVLKDEFSKTFKEYDLLIGPTSSILPFKIGEKINDPVSMYLADVNTVNINLAGVPALSMPIKKSSGGLPIGLQIIGDYLSESKIFNLAHKLEQQLKEREVC